MTVFDSSALLAYLRGEEGADHVVGVLSSGGVCSTANWAEVAHKVRGAGADWDLARSLLLSYDLTLEPVGIADAELAAALWKRGEGLSLADRLCLALGARLGADILTCDAAWQGRAGVVVVR